MMTDDCASHFRLKVKGILLRFVRRFGYDIVARMVPESHQKILSNIRKLENRRRRGESMASGSGGSELDEEDAKTQRSRRTTRKGDSFEEMLGSESESGGEDEEDARDKQAEKGRRKKVRPSFGLCRFDCSWDYHY